MLATWRALANAALDLLFPPRCIGCHADGEWICAQCKSQIAYIPAARQGRLDDDPPGAHDAPILDGVYALSYHEGIAREAIHQLKYEGVRALVAPLSALLADFWNEQALFADVLIPVPLHPRRQRERGYNQSRLLAEALGRRLNVPVNTDALQRDRYTAPQVGLNAQERHQNVNGAFRCTQTLKVDYAMLIDDVCTTGATLTACARALKEQGVRYVWALTLARPRGADEIDTPFASR